MIFNPMIFVCLAMTPLVVLGSDSEESRETLRGLVGAGVSVQIGANKGEYGDLRTQLQTDVELRLRQSGFKVLTYKERASAGGNPLLAVDVIVGDKIQNTLYCFVEVELLQGVVLKRDPSIADWIGTWSSKRRFGG